MPTPSPLAADLHLTWPLAISTLFVAGYWAFLFFVFSGRVDLRDAVVAGLVGAALTQATNVLVIIASHYYWRGAQPRKPDEQ